MADRLTIQRYPTGLLDFLGMQSTGDTPHSVGEQITGVMDLTDMYAIDRLRSQLTSVGPITGVNAFSGQAGQDVPAGEMWLVQGITMTGAVMAAGVTIKVQPYIFRKSIATLELIGIPATFTIGEAFNVGVYFDRWALMRPGDNIGVNCWSSAGAPNQSVNGTVIYVPVKV